MSREGSGASCIQEALSTGTGGDACSADAKRAGGAACSSDSNPCTLDECNGTSNDCQHPAGNAGALCRAGSGDACDPDELCTGTGSACPPDVVQPASVIC